MTAARRRTRCRTCGARLVQEGAGDRCPPCATRATALLATPPDVPGTFWTDSAVARALAQRHMGKVIRAYRRHPFHGVTPLTQEIVARWMGITQAQLSRIENGPPPVHLDRLVQMARLFRIPAHLLWFVLPTTRFGRQFETDETAALTHPLTQVAAQQSPYVALLPPSDVCDGMNMWSALITPELANQFTREDLMLDRRTVTRAMAGGAVLGGIALLEPVERWLFNSTEEPHVARGGSVGPRLKIGYQEIEEIERVALIFRAWDDQFGGGLRRKAVVGQLNEVANLLTEPHPQEIARRLQGTMAQLSETAAVMSWDSGEQALAQRYYILALRSAQLAGDTPFVATVLAGMARQLLYLDRPADALELVRLALDRLVGQGTPAVSAMLHTREAWAYARQGRISAFRRAMDKAEEAFAEKACTFEPPWIEYFDAAELNGTMGGRLLELAHEHPGLAGEASDRIELAISHRRAGRLRSSALDRLGLAESRLIQGEVDEAARLGHEAAEVAERTPSARVRVQLADLYHSTDPYRKVVSVANLRERLLPLMPLTAAPAP